jgi:hypothetical protein
MELESCSASPATEYPMAFQSEYSGSAVVCSPNLGTVDGCGTRISKHSIRLLSSRCFLRPLSPCRTSVPVGRVPLLHMCSRLTSRQIPYTDFMKAACSTCENFPKMQRALGCSQYSVKAVTSVLSTFSCHHHSCSGHLSNSL